MTQRMWHTQTDGDTVTLARALPARFDVSASASFPMLARARLAHQIRQDMWRALQNIRGFSPVVRVERSDAGLRVTAGGRVPKPISKHIAERIEVLLNDEVLRARWIKCAQVRMTG
jgi:hypothetical protein